jgi:hypothetical protein
LSGYADIDFHLDAVHVPFAPSLDCSCSRIWPSIHPSFDLKAVRQGIKQAGYFENRKIAIKYCSANGRFDQLPALAPVLVADLRIGQDISTTGSLRREDGEELRPFFRTRLAIRVDSTLGTFRDR